MREEFVDPQYRPEDHIEQADETGLRPKSLDEFVGQRELKEHLGIVLEAARRRGQAAGSPPRASSLAWCVPCH